MEFKTFAKAVHSRYEEMAKGELFVADVQDLFETYLAAFPQGSNPIFRERTQHDCNCCKQFIRKLGVLVSIDADGVSHSVWDDLKLAHPYDTVAEKLSDLVRQAPIRSVFRSKERSYGQEHNYDTKTNQRWDHFHGAVVTKHYSQTPETKRGEQDAIAQVLRRGLTEISREDLATVLDLIDSNALYRGAEHREAVKGFLALKAAYDAFPGAAQNFIWANLSNRNARFRNTAIGTLLVDLASGTELEDAVRKFEAMVAPANYKRPTALITKKMVDQAVATLQELGLEGAIHRRFARISDVSVNNVLFVERSVRGYMKDGAADLLATSVKPTEKPKQATAISIDTFVASILPTAVSLHAFVENRHQGNFVSLTGGDGPERLFKWNNNFAWSYEGEVTDSIKARVKRAGGNVSALMRVSLAWFNYDDLDIHCRTPDGKHIYYGDRYGILDVDMNAAHLRDSRTPVENLAFKTLRDGIYRIQVNNYVRKETVDGGFVLEVECNGNLQQFNHAAAVRNGQTIEALHLHVKNGALEKIIVAPGLVGGTASIEKWSIKTETLVPVTIAMTSPNHWDDNAVGQKHWFFMLKDCKNPDPVRGIYNEFLRPDLEKHRKVFEVLGSKTKCPPTDDQISGVGFSSARNDTVTIVVNDRRAFNVQF